MRISIASDHGGFAAKAQVIDHLKKEGYEVTDRGTDSLDSCDYPIFGSRAAFDLLDGKADIAVLICNSGEGMCMVANKVKGVRAAILYNDEVAALARQHNNANAICFGTKFMPVADIIRRIDIFLGSKFEAGRHARRVDEMMKVEGGERI